MCPPVPSSTSLVDGTGTESSMRGLDVVLDDKDSVNESSGTSDLSERIDLLRTKFSCARVRLDIGLGDREGEASPRAVVVECPNSTVL